MPKSFNVCIIALEQEFVGNIECYEIDDEDKFNAINETLHDNVEVAIELTKLYGRRTDKIYADAIVQR
jgi:hypothetical protein